MKRLLLFVCLLAAAVCVAQNTQPVDERYMLRKQVFGDYARTGDVMAYKFDTADVVLFNTGYVATKEEFLFLFYSVPRKDSTAAGKKQFLDEFTLSRQRVFEAMEQCLDTAYSFQLGFLIHKQNFITPYLDKGYTRVEAEALPEVKYALRQEYSSMIITELLRKEIWSKATTFNLKAFYTTHPELYQGQSFEISRTKVVYDYQKQLEEELNERVRNKFQYKANTAVVNRL